MEDGIIIDKNGEASFATDRIKKKKPHFNDGNIPANKFQKGNKMGVKFGQGQPTGNGGRPKSDKTVLEEMKAAAETYGLASSKIANAIVKLSLDETVEPKHRFSFMKEANLRTFGQPKNSIEDTLKHINDKVDKLYELTMPLLEATAIGDGVGIVRELMKQGKLDEVVEKVKEEKGDS